MGTPENNFSLIEDFKSVDPTLGNDNSVIDSVDLNEEKHVTPKGKINLTIHNKIVILRKRILKRNFWPDEPKIWDINYYWQLRRMFKLIKSGKAVMPVWLFSTKS